MKKTILLACLSLCCMSVASAAGTLRCDGKIIRVGVPAAYVLAQCGAPHNKVVQQSAARAGNLNGTSRLVGVALSEQWVYDRGWGRFPALLVFVEGDLRREVSQNIKRLQEIGCYRGLRHRYNLPVHGQRTRTNARTKRGPRRTVPGRGKRRGMRKK